MLDPGGFGAVTITKSISIEADGLIAGVLVSGTNGIVITGGAGFVVLRGLTIDGIGTGLAGIRFQGGNSLFVENCTINNFSGAGIDVVPSANAQINIKDTKLRNNAGGGIYLHPSGGTTMTSIDHVRSEGNGFGVRADDNTKTMITNSSASNNTNNGFVIVGNSALSEMNLESCLTFGNGGAALVGGLKAVGANAIMRISNVTATDNRDVLTIVSGGQVLTYGNNHFAGNTNEATNPTGPVPGNPK